MKPRKQGTQVDIWQAPDMKAELLRGRFVDFSYDVHSHETACFALLTAGKIRIRMRGTEFVAQRGDIYAIDADEAHAGWAVDDEGWRQRTLYVDADHLRSLVGDERARRSIRIAGPLIHDAKVASLLHGVHHCSQIKGPQLLRDQAYIAFATELMQRHVRDMPATAVAREEPLAVRTARELLDTHLDDRVSLQMLAAQAKVPPFVLLRAFERSVGMTPHAYQRQARVRLAMQLIRSRHSIGDASLMAGFADQAHCTRWFRRFMGITPGQYQASLAGRRLQ